MRDSIDPCGGRARRAWSWLLLCVLAALACNASALTWDESNDGTVLQVRDCRHGDRQARRDEDRADCVAQWKAKCGGGFCDAGDGYAGDAERLTRQLASKPYKEVWLYSNGGSVTAGIDVGLALRDVTATVRVPRGRDCISACTIAFMGGRWRYVDDPFSFKVHSASAFTKLESVDARLARAGGDWRKLAALVYVVTADNLFRLVSYFDDTSTSMQAPAVRANLQAVAAALRGQATSSPSALVRAARQTGASTEPAERWAERCLERLRLSMGGQSLDDRLALEGPALRHTVALQIERQAAADVIAEIRGRLGTDARTHVAGLDKVDVMYSTTIIDVFEPSQVVLVNRGYVSAIVGERRR